MNRTKKSMLYWTPCRKRIRNSAEGERRDPDGDLSRDGSAGSQRVSSAGKPGDEFMRNDIVTLIEVFEQGVLDAKKRRHQRKPCITTLTLDPLLMKWLRTSKVSVCEIALLIAILCVFCRERLSALSRSQ